MKRRESLHKIIIGGATVFLMPSVITSCQKDPADPNNNNNNNPPPPGSTITLDLNNAAYSALKNTGGSVVVQSIIVANTGSGYAALDSACTHNGCTIGYSAASNNFPCPCHGSVFSATGSVVNGPATTSLKSYSVSVANNILTITL
jgi:cytochrome b6-f complex iron-sulfur subunit